MTKRIMRAFKMQEISSVDRPAQAHARMTIMKRDDSEDYWKRDFSQDQRNHLASTGAALPDGSFPISTTADLKNAIHAIGRAKDPAKAKAHIIARAKSLGATSALPDGWVTKGVLNMDPKELQKMIDDAVKAATGEITKKLADTTSQLEAITKASKKKPVMEADGIPEPDADDEDTKKAWRAYTEKCVAKAVAKAKEDFDAEIAKNADIAKNDESFTGEGGVVIRKSDYAKAEHYTLAKAQQDRLEMQDFTKRAETEIPSLPGTPVAKAKALRAVSKLAKEDREAIEAMLKGGNAAMAAQMKAVGKDGSGEGSAEAELDKMAKTYSAEHKVSYNEAYTKVLDTKEGKDLYAKSLTEKTPRAA